MNQESQNKTWISCAAIAAVIIAAIIGLGMPFAERLADVYFPLLTPAPNFSPSTEVVSQNPAPTTNLPANQPTIAQVSTPGSNISVQGTTPLRDQKDTSIVGTGVLEVGTYSDGMAPISASDISSHLNIQRIRIEENPDGCSIAFMDADRIWFGSSVKTNLTINGVVVGTINGPTGKHGYIFNTTVHSGDKVCVSYFEPSGFQIVFGPDIYYHYDSYCYRGNC